MSPLLNHIATYSSVVLIRELNCSVGMRIPVSQQGSTLSARRDYRDSTGFRVPSDQVASNFAGGERPHIHIEQMLATRSAHSAIERLHESDLLAIVHFQPHTLLN